MSSATLYNEMKNLWEAFEENHVKFTEKGNKAAATRARKSVGELKKIISTYRKESVLESKG